MVIQIALLIVGVIYAFRLPGIYGARPGDFPRVSKAALREWKRLELISIYLFLGATWGTLILGILLAVVLGPNFQIAVFGVNGLSLALMMILLIPSAIFGSDAAKIRKRFKAGSTAGSQSSAAPPPPFPEVAARFPDTFGLAAAPVRLAGSDETFKFACLACGQRISTTRSAVGTTGVCPGCGSDVRVPDPSLSS